MSGYSSAKYPYQRVGYTVGTVAAGALNMYSGQKRGYGQRGRKRQVKRDYVGCFTSQYKNVGKRMGSRRFRNALIDSNRVSNTYRVSGQLGSTTTIGTLTCTGAMSNKFGTYGLACGQSAAGAVVNAPIFVFDITSVPNGTMGEASTPVYPITGWKCTYASEAKGSAVTWTAINLPPDSTASFQAENTQKEFKAGPHSLMNWMEAKFLFYPAAKTSSRINIDLVEFKEDSVMPGGINASSPGVINDTYAKAFWESMLKKYMYSPLEAGNTNLEKKFVKYLFRDSISLDCPKTIEVEPNHVRHYNLFKRLNRIVTYNWGDTGTMTAYHTTGSGVGNQDWIQNAAVFNQNTARPNKRLFLMIRGYSTFCTNSNLFQQSIHPSFDMVLRKKHTSLSP